MGSSNDMMYSVLHLSDYQISPETGFLPERPPLPRLPGECFAPWEDLLLQLPQLIKSKKIREEVDKLPDLEFTSSTLKSEEEWKRAYTMLCFLGQSYIWMDGQKGIVEKVPKKIAVPWCAVSEHLKIKPVGCYASTVLFNYSLRNPQEHLDEENLFAVNTFTGTEDESWFYTTFVLIELASASALRAIEQIYRELAEENEEGVQKCLQDIQQSLKNIRSKTNNMFLKCKPVTFYVEIRPFQAGSKGLDALPNGLLYEGVDCQYHQYHGANAGQSAIIYAIDAVLGTSHYGDGKSYMDAMKQYMPQPHRQFLNHLRQMPSVREFCRKSENPDLKASYNHTAKELGQFRTDHVILVTRYIVNQLPHSVNPALDKKGSGGTDFMGLLQKIRNETLSAIIK